MRPYRGKPVLDPKGDFIYGWYAKRCYCVGSSGPDIITDVIYDIDNLLPIEVLPKTVSQSTGLFDGTEWENATEEQRRGYTKKTWNGVEIFGKDIIQLEYTSVPIFRRQVEFNKGAYGYYEPILDKPNFISLCYPCGNKMSSKSWIVIGNAVDNGELLKG